VPNLAAPILVRNDAVRARPRTRTSAARSTPAAVASYRRPRQPELQSGAPVLARAPAPENRSTTPAADRAGEPLVMIDPGHGGYDPGTESAGGVEEKDLALQIALRLRMTLAARGVRVAMTRTSDRFIPLAERTALANRAGADLFVSIHLNSSPNRETTGIEVYYLNNTTDRATIRLARMENGGGGAPYGARGGANLNYILADLRQQYKAAESASLARMIDAQAVADLDGELGLNVNSLGARKGPFWVLVGAQMPAVLVECGFLSNPGEADRLASGQYQEVLAGAMADAIVHYFNADAAVGNL
jgi:N-acetylmuramoyl-L-alanine amidase